jgi:hypothetical protein
VVTAVVSAVREVRSTWVKVLVLTTGPEGGQSGPSMLRHPRRRKEAWCEARCRQYGDRFGSATAARRWQLGTQIGGA